MLLTGLFPIAPHLSLPGDIFFAIGQPRTGSNATGVASPVLSREGSPLFGNTVSNEVQDTCSHLWGEVTLLVHV